MARLTKTAVRKLIKEHRGNISAVARAMQRSRMQVYRYVREKYPDLWEEVEDAREELLDDVESELYRQGLKEGNTTALIFIAKTQGKKRGWVERQEHDMNPDGQSIRITVSKE